MAQTGFTPIQLYSTSTAAATPSASNLTNSTLGSELAINITDGKLFYKDNANNVQVIGWKTVPTTAGGTGLTTYTAGDLSYYASGTAFTKLAIGTIGQILTSTGSAPQWTTLSGVAVTTFSAGTTGFTPNSATSGAVTLAGTLATTNGGTGLTAFTANQIFYASSTSAIGQSANLTFNGTTLTANTIGAFTLSGTIAGGGNQINNVIIGASTPLAGSFTTLSASGVATFSAGTVSLPAITTTGDTNTGIFFPAADTIAFAEGGAEAMRIDSSARLGIGTVSPAGKVTIADGNRSINGLGTLNIFSTNTQATDNGGSLALGGQNGSAGSFDPWSFATLKGAKENSTSGNLAGYFAIATANSGGTLTEATRVHSSGGVSIGNTTDPGATNLSVTGNVVMATSGKGIDFSANSHAGGMTSELLTWYEEGTWTPTDQSGASLSFTGVTGKYTRIGRQVTCFAWLTYPANANALAMTLGGLPFNIKSTDDGAGVSIYCSAGFQLFFRPNSTTVFISVKNDNSTVLNSALSGALIGFHLTYFV